MSGTIAPRALGLDGGQLTTFYLRHRSPLACYQYVIDLSYSLNKLACCYQIEYALA